jgi:hypothetical protein
MRTPFRDDKPFPDDLSADDLRVLRNWRRGLFLFYGAILVIGVCLVSWHPQPPGGSNEIASTAVPGPPPGSTQRSR